MATGGPAGSFVSGEIQSNPEIQSGKHKAPKHKSGDLVREAQDPKAQTQGLSQGSTGPQGANELQDVKAFETNGASTRSIVA